MSASISDTSAPNPDARTEDAALSPARPFRAHFESILAWYLVVVLAWAPFPIGSNRAWSWSLLVILIAAAWLIWLAAIWSEPERVLRQARPLVVPVVLAAAALLWGVVQIVPFVPAGWAHPVWSVAATALGHNLPATISLDPWRTETELMKLAAYAMCAWLFYALARDGRRARFLFLAIVAIGVFYAVYAWLFSVMNWSQFQLFYAGPDAGSRTASPFVDRNSLATYAGVIGIACAAKLFELGSRFVGRQKGLGRLVLSVMHFAFGKGTVILLATFGTLSLVIATGSRGGALATLVAGVAMLVLASAGWMRAKTDRWTLLTTAALLISLVALAALNGGELTRRLTDMAQMGLSEDLRVTLWNTSERMISDSPFMGLGLGTFEKAYPLYNQDFYRFIVDKAHNDFLELAAGWGLPAAIAWLSAIGFLVATCVRGVFVRRRDRLHSLIAVGATVLIVVQSLVEFPLQIPAIAVLYAALLGIGVGQAFPSRERHAFR